MPGLGRGDNGALQGAVRPPRELIPWVLVRPAPPALPPLPSPHAGPGIARGPRQHARDQFQLRPRWPAARARLPAALWLLADPRRPPGRGRAAARRSARRPRKRRSPRGSCRRGRRRSGCARWRGNRRRCHARAGASTAAPAWSCCRCRGSAALAGGEALAEPFEHVTVLLVAARDDDRVAVLADRHLRHQVVVGPGDRGRSLGKALGGAEARPVVGDGDAEPGEGRDLRQRLADVAGAEDPHGRGRQGFHEDGHLAAAHQARVRRILFGESKERGCSSASTCRAMS